MERPSSIHPCALNVPESDEDFKQRVEDVLPDQATPVVVYCANEDCQASPRAAKKLEDLGYVNVFDFEAGLAGWRRAGHDLTGSPQQVQAG